MATSGDIHLAIREDFYMATDTSNPGPADSESAGSYLQSPPAGVGAIPRKPSLCRPLTVPPA